MDATLYTALGILLVIIGVLSYAIGRSVYELLKSEIDPSIEDDDLN